MELGKLLGAIRDVAPESFLFLLFLARCLRYAWSQRPVQSHRYMSKLRERTVGPSPSPSSQLSWLFKDSVSNSKSEGKAIGISGTVAVAEALR